MMEMLLYFVVMAAAMLGISRIVPGFVVDGWVPAILGAVVLALMNVLVKPILFILTLPFTILTLGLFLLILNAIVLWLTAAFVPGFHITSFVPAFVGSLLLAVVGMVWKAATQSK